MGLLYLYLYLYVLECLNAMNYKLSKFVILV